jgi:hypothetical protein
MWSPLVVSKRAWNSRILAASPGGLPRNSRFFLAAIADFFGRPAPLGFLGNTGTLTCVDKEGESTEEDTSTESWSFISNFDVFLQYRSALLITLTRSIKFIFNYCAIIAYACNIEVIIAHFC